MAFTVAPTSGEPPFTLSAEVSNVEYVDGVNYVASVAFSILSGVCPTQGATVPFSQEDVKSLLDGQDVIRGTTPVATGSCRTYTMQIRRVSDGAVVATSNATIDNI